MRHIYNAVVFATIAAVCVWGISQLGWHPVAALFCGAIAFMLASDG